MKRARRGGEERSRYRKALGVGLLVSLAVHLLALLFVGGTVERLPDRVPTPPEAPPLREALRAVAVEPAAPEAVSEPAPPEVGREPSPAAEAGLPSLEPAAAPGGIPRAVPRMTNAERLRPRAGDLRLWAELDPDELTRSQRRRLRRARKALRGFLRAYLDSLQLSREQRRAAREWVVEGEGDKKWGISSEGLHLGDVTIPIPFGQFLRASGPKRRELEQALRDYNMIQQQASKLEAEAVRKERLKAMRARTREKLEERLEEADGSEADSAARDTAGTGSGG